MLYNTHIYIEPPNQQLIINDVLHNMFFFLLFKLYYQYLLDSGVDGSRIITVPLDDDDYEELRDSKKLSMYIK